jgi:hypothetical protein
MMEGGETDMTEEKAQELMAKKDAYTQILNHVAELIASMEMNVDEIIKPDLLDDYEKKNINEALRLAASPETKKTFMATVGMLTMRLRETEAKLDLLPGPRP